MFSVDIFRELLEVPENKTSSSEQPDSSATQAKGTSTEPAAMDIDESVVDTKQSSVWPEAVRSGRWVGRKGIADPGQSATPASSDNFTSPYIVHHSKYIRLCLCWCTE